MFTEGWDARRAFTGAEVLANLPTRISNSESQKFRVLITLLFQRLKLLPPMRETRVQSLGWEDPLEKEMVTHSSILAWRIPWREEPGGLQSMGSQIVGHN